MKIIVLIIAINLMSQGMGYANDHISSMNTKAIIKCSKVNKELHLLLSPEPHLTLRSKKILIKDISSFVKENDQGNSKWTLYLPDAIPIDAAIQLFQQFLIANCANVAVYAEDANGDWIKREIGIEVGPTNRIEIVTQFKTEYPKPLQKYIGNNVTENLFVAECKIAEINNILPLLLKISPKKHVRFVESGGIEGMPAVRYVEILKIMKGLGVLTVSFYGVYIE